jgi:sugar lactone lactonase YvrE
VSLHADVSDLGGMHLNDMVSDRRGRCYVNCLSYPGTWPEPEILESGARRIPFLLHPGPDTQTDRIALVEPDGAHRIVADGLLGPNGMAVSAQGDRLVVSEWRARRVASFRIDPFDGSLSDYRVVYEMGEAGTDGLCLDVEGAVWCAAPMSGECRRISCAGEVVDVARARTGHRVMACVLGGPDRRTLFMMTNRRPEPTTGTVEAVQVRVPGAGRP